MTKSRDERRAAIRTIVRSTPIATQKELASALSNAGFSCTQATVSRDVAEMRIAKQPDGFYVLAEDLRFQRMVSSQVERVKRVGNLLLVKTIEGGAQGVAAAIDAADLPGLAGTLAGDDTILGVVETEDDASNLVELFKSYQH